MKKETRPSRLVMRFFLTIIIRLLFSVGKIMSYKNKLELETPCVVAVFHDEFIPVFYHMNNSNSVVLASSNHAGFCGAKILKEWGHDIIYLTSKKKGKKALEELVKKVKQGKNVILNPDGSKGPRHKMKAGAVVLAKKANVPLYLVSPKYKGFRINCTWDRFLCPLPFSSVYFNYTKMIIDPELSREEVGEKILEAEKKLQDLSKHNM